LQSLSAQHVTEVRDEEAPLEHGHA
jgi:hypothetical protein